MTHTYAAQVLADSLSPAGVRLTTFQITFPRFILAEFNTHRVFSRNSASSRAIPPNDTVVDGVVTKKGLINQVREFMFCPETLGRRVAGMGYGEALDEAELEAALDIWREAGHCAAEFAARINALNVDKSRVNRLLEAFMWHTVIVTSSEWSNFFSLRQPATGPVPSNEFPAQPEIQIIARMMSDALQHSQPRQFAEGEWALPMVTDAEHGGERTLSWAEVSSGRTARVSFDTQDRIEAPETGRARHERLTDDAHWSPAEHPARPLTAADLYDPELNKKILVPGDHALEIAAGATPDPARMWCGNFRGWVQLRALHTYEHDRSLWETAIAAA
jgi:hypothetical protein